jgi:predicted RNA-binding Zn ribbon-like protein
MLRVTWEWIGIDAAALDVANTIAVSAGVAHDLLEPDGEYERWAEAAAASPALDGDVAAALAQAREDVLALREPIREVLFATAAGGPLPTAAVAKLNRASRAAPSWVELGRGGVVHERTAGTAVARLVALYARSAMAVAADGPSRLRACPAPSCGMLYRPRRAQQQWCSTQCGTRARVARHYVRSSRRQ